MAERGQRATRAGLLAIGLALACAPSGPIQIPLTGTDGCSKVPDLGPAVACCFRHDEFYRFGGVTTASWSERQRKAADLYLLACLESFEHVPESVAWAYYKGVRIGGGGSWERNRKAAEP